MKRVYIVRHGKSHWDQLDLSDIERPLRKRGIKNSEDMSAHMLDLGWIPDLILSSPAVRAYDTAKIFADTLEVRGSSFKVDEKLYLPDFPSLLKFILYLSDEVESVMIVGHEPSLSNLVNHFLPNNLEKLVTGSLTALTFKTNEWREVSPDTLHSAVHKNRHNIEGYALL